jgi:hypothetical protein
MPKKSNTPFTYYTFRYDYTDDNQLEKIKNYIIRDYPKYAIFKEVSTEVGKNHIQGKIGRALSLIQIRKHLLNEFPDVFTRSNYSLSEIKNPDEYDSYICKDGKPLCNNIFTEEYIKAQVEKHKTLVVAFEKKKQKKESATTFTLKVAQDFVIENPLDVRDIQSGYATRWKPTESELKRYDDACGNLLKFILKRLGKVAKCFDSNILQRMYTGIKNHVILLDDYCIESNFEKHKKFIQL